MSSLPIFPPLGLSQQFCKSANPGLATLRHFNIQHKQSIESKIRSLETTIQSYDITSNVDTNVYMYLYLLINKIIKLQANPVCVAYNKLCMLDYMYLLKLANRILSLGEITRYNTTLQNNCILCIYVLNYLIQLFPVPFTPMPKAFEFGANNPVQTVPPNNPLQTVCLDERMMGYYKSLLDDNNIVAGLLKVYINIKKYEQLTNTGYIDQINTIYTCIDKLINESSIACVNDKNDNLELANRNLLVDVMLDELSSNILVPGSDKCITELNIDRNEFNKLFGIKVVPATILLNYEQDEENKNIDSTNATNNMDDAMSEPDYTSHESDIDWD